MNFSDDEIASAKELKRLGVAWEPAVGDYVLDETKFCKQDSPFQDRVYFILNYPYFMRAVGGVARFKEIMIWLPTWSHLRKLLSDLGVSHSEIASHLAKTQAIETGNERLELYRMLEERLAPES